MFLTQWIEEKIYFYKEKQTMYFFFFDKIKQTNNVIEL